MKHNRLSLLADYWLSPDEALFREDVVAARMDVKVTTIQSHRWEKIGVPFVKMGKLVRYRKGDIEAYIAQNNKVRAKPSK